MLGFTVGVQWPKASPWMVAWLGVAVALTMHVFIRAGSDRR